MGGLIALSEIARNLALPVIAVLGAFIALWQAKMSKRKNGFDLVVKAGELYAIDNREKRLASYAALLEASFNTDSRQVATVLFSSYVSRESDLATLQALRDVASDATALKWIEARIASVDSADSEV